ncbi:unnamed protein product [Sympodiomycopsis kandeliae]
MPGSLREIPSRNSSDSAQHRPQQDTTYRHDDEEASVGSAPRGPSTLAGHSSPIDENEKSSKSGKDYPQDKAEVMSVTSGSVDQSAYRTMSWQKTAALLFAEYVCLAILAFPAAFSVLGMAGGILCVIGLGLITLYTSLKLHSYCMKHPNLLHIADIGRQLFGGHWLAYELTALALILNNCFLMGLHTLTVSEVINTLALPGSFCTVGASVIALFVCALGTLPRKLESIAIMGIVSAVLMFIAIVLTLSFSGAQGREPAGFISSEPVTITAWAPKGTTFVAGLNACLNILFTWVGQIVYPTFISEMKHPEDFPKALYAVTATEFALFLTVGIVVYWYSGQYAAAPAVTVISNVKYKKAAFAPVLVVSVLIGIIYGSVVSKYIFVRVFGKTKHYSSNTTVGWIGWIVIVFAAWTFGWVVGEAVPFFDTLISLMSALFDGWFGFIFEAMMFFEISKGNLWKGQTLLRKAETIFCVFLIIAGLFIFGAGTYTSAQAIVDNYAAGLVKSPFGCASNAV